MVNRGDQLLIRFQPCKSVNILLDFFFCGVPFSVFFSFIDFMLMFCSLVL